MPTADTARTKSPPDGAPYSLTLEEMLNCAGAETKTHGRSYDDALFPPPPLATRSPRRADTVPDDGAERVPPRDFDAEQAVLGSMLLEPGAAAKHDRGRQMAATAREPITEEPRPLAHDTTAENAIMCAVLGDPDGNRWADECLQIVRPADFFHEAHQVIWQAIKTLRAQGLDADLVNVAGELQRLGRLQDCGGVQYLDALRREDPFPERAARRAQIVKQAALKRRIGEQVAPALRALAFDETDDPEGAIGAAIEELQAVRTAWQPAQVAVPLSFLEADDILGETSWAWPGWLADGALHILCAPPAGGKSFVGLDLMRCFATGADWPDGAENEREPGNCLLVDYEATAREYIERARAAGMPLGRLFFQPADALPYLTDGGSFDLLRKWIADIDAQFVVLDSWRDGAPGVNEDSSGEVAPTLQPLRVIGAEFNVPLLLHHHPGKIFGDSWTMQPGSLRGSGVFLSEPRLAWAIDKPNPASEARVLKVLKRNAGPQPEPIGFTITDAGLDWGEPTRRSRARPRMDSAKRHVTDAVLRGARSFSAIMEFCLAAGDKEKTTEGAIQELVAANIITICPDGTYGLPAHHGEQPQ